MSKTKIYCNATLGERRRVKAKIARTCKHPDGAYLDTVLLTLFLTHFKALQLPFQPQHFQGTVCIYHLE